MLYLNQLNYRHLPYNHNIAHGGVSDDRRNAATSGCGPCSLCMVVDRLTTRKLELDECLRMSEQYGANIDLGTRMDILGPIIADMYGLQYCATRDIEELKSCLRNGGCVIIHAEGDHDGHIGVFTHRGHYITAISIDEDDDICILDPSLAEGKFEEEGRQGKVTVKAPFVYCKPQLLVEEAFAPRPSFHLFRRKK